MVWAFRRASDLAPPSPPQATVARVRTCYHIFPGVSIDESIRRAGRAPLAATPMPPKGYGGIPGGS